MIAISAEPYLTLSEAAKLAGRSYSWAWERAADGRFETHRSREGGPVRITAASLATTLRRERPARRRNHLQLVVNNSR